jgi:hypothetical protein
MFTVSLSSHNKKFQNLYIWEDLFKQLDGPLYFCMGYLVSHKYLFLQNLTYQIF